MSTTTTNANHELRTIAGQALAAIGDQFVLTQSRCVDVLLDLLQVTNDEVIQATIEDRLNDIRFVSMVEADDMRADLEAILELVEDDQTVDLSSFELAAACVCTRCRTVTDRAVHSAQAVATVGTRSHDTMS